MKISIYGKNKYEVKPKLRSYVEEKVEEIGDMLRDSTDITAKVICKEYGDTKVVEVTIPTKHLILRSEAAADDMFMAVDSAVAKIEKQLLRHKKKINSIIRKRDGIANYFSEQVENTESEETESKLVKTKDIDLDVMSVDEAILQLELLGHDFYMFINEENHKVTTVYLRSDGDYAIIRVK